MANKVVKPVTVKSTFTNPLKAKLIAVVNKVLKENETELTNDIQKAVNKSVKKIIKKTEEKILNTF